MSTKEEDVQALLDAQEQQKVLVVSPWNCLTVCPLTFDRSSVSPFDRLTAPPFDRSHPCTR
eukprot:3675805-Rhodomonas_salina.1